MTAISLQHGVVEELEAFAAAMYAKGAEDMRERAATVCSLLGRNNHPDACITAADMASDCSDAIRALLITHTNTEGEQG